jgi:hypothetical protein
VPQVTVSNRGPQEIGCRPSRSVRTETMRLCRLHVGLWSHTTSASRIFAQRGGIAPPAGGAGRRSSSGAAFSGGSSLGSLSHRCQGCRTDDVRLTPALKKRFPPNTSLKPLRWELDHLADGVAAAGAIEGSRFVALDLGIDAPQGHPLAAPRTRRLDLPPHALNPIIAGCHDGSIREWRAETQC